MQHFNFSVLRFFGKIYRMIAGKLTTYAANLKNVFMSFASNRIENVSAATKNP